MAAFPMTIEEYERLDPVALVNHEGIEVRYCTPNKMTAWRVQTLHDKEPYTLDWIKSFGAEDVLADVGANVGTYTIWAAKTRGTRVFAFEPEGQNYALLMRNILYNDLGERVTAFCLGLSDTVGYGEMFLSELRTGGSCHAVGEKLNFKLEPMNTQLSQGCHFTTLDELVARQVLPQPNHIKIDVDGFEYKVAAGAKSTLENPSLRSLLVEVNTNLEEHRALVEHLQSLGFAYSEDQVGAAFHHDGTFKGVANHVFRR